MDTVGKNTVILSSRGGTVAVKMRVVRLGSKKLTDRQIKSIIAERAEGTSYNNIAKKHKISVNTVKKYCLSDSEFAQKCTQKKEENTKSILEHMDKKKDLVCEIIDGCLSALADPNRLKTSNTREIATALGIIIDKFTKVDNGDELNKLDKVLEKIEGNI